MSLYGEYVKERLGDEIYENQYGFATYRYLNDKKTVYIVDLYVIPTERKTRVASLFADTICKIAKEQGATELLGTVSPSANAATESLKVLLGYGMSLVSSTHEMIVFRKDI